MSALDGIFDGLPNHLQIDDLCEIFGCQRATAYRWLNEGTIPGYRVGKSWLVLRDEVRATVAAGSNRALPGVEGE